MQLPLGHNRVTVQFVPVAEATWTDQPAMSTAVVSRLNNSMKSFLKGAPESPPPPNTWLITTFGSGSIVGSGDGGGVGVDVGVGIGEGVGFAVGVGVGAGVGVGVGVAAQLFNGDWLLRGFGEPVAKSTALSFVS